MFKVTCPICKGALEIDERTREIVGHKTKEIAAQTGDERLQSVVEKIEKAKVERETALERGKAREAEHGRRIEKLFKKAQDKAKEAPEEEPPKGPVWD